MSRIRAVLSFFCLISVCLVLWRCGLSRPAVTDTTWQKPIVDHANPNFTSTCSPCHEADRAAPVNGVVHGNGADCVACHRYTSDASFLSLMQNTHVPLPSTCIACHSSMLPVAPHQQTSRECATCHTFPDWSKQIQ